MGEEVKISVVVGDSAMDFQGGNYLNAINEVTAFFLNSRTIDGAHLKAALMMYASQMED